VARTEICAQVQGMSQYIGRGWKIPNILHFQGVHFILNMFILIFYDLSQFGIYTKF